MIHGFCKNGTGILLDVASGAVHVSDEATVEVARMLRPPLAAACPDEVKAAMAGRLDAEEVGEIYGELYALYQEGLLFSEEQDVTDKLSLSDKGSPIKALCLHVCHDCNLRCKYCFGDTGDFGTGRRMIMTPETAKAAIDFVIARSENRRNIEIDFFGGEPLMAFSTVRETVAYAKEQGAKHGKNFRFTVTTNGVLLDDEITDYINREMSNVVLSLDGRKEVNDRMRKTVNGKGSYDLIVPKFKKVADAREGKKDYYVRGTFTAENLDFAEDVLSMADAGFKQLSVEPVVSEASCPWALKEEDLPQIFAEYDRLTDEMLRRRAEGKGFNFFHFMVDLEGGPCIIKRLRGCGAGFEYVAIAPDGDIYPCHQFVGKEEYRLGNLFDGTFDRDLSKNFAKINVYTRKDCQQCWAKYYCSGGCSASNLTTGGDINKTYRLGCEMEKKRLECALYLKVMEMQQ